jgi:hypothetical protein
MNLVETNAWQGNVISKSTINAVFLELNIIFKMRVCLNRNVRIDSACVFAYIYTCVHTYICRHMHRACCSAGIQLDVYVR